MFPEVKWFFDLYEIHFGRVAPQSAREDILAAESVAESIFGEYAGHILGYILSRGWNRENPEDVVSFARSIRTLFAQNTNTLRQLWDRLKGGITGNYRADDKLFRAIGEYLLRSVESGAGIDCVRGYREIRTLLEGL